MENELFEKTSIPKAYMKLALPVVLSMVDTYFIALTGVSFLLVFRGQVLGILGADETTRQYASDYYTWIVLVAICIINTKVLRRHE